MYVRAYVQPITLPLIHFAIDNAAAIYMCAH